LRFYDFASKKEKVIGDIDARPYQALTISPDRKILLFGAFKLESNDLMLIENFR
jgi:uncharacterized protein YdeI (BOF family)